ncbi:MAG: DUF4433 domain-containing protein [Gammaproteobacteria bacterium]
MIKKFGISAVWHFTDHSNLESINENGLLSFVEARNRGINIPIRGGNELSQYLDSTRGLDRFGRGLDRFVHLAFIADHPMLYKARQSGRIQNPIWIKIDSSVILSESVRFCPVVSNSADAYILDAQQVKQALAIDFWALFGNWPRGDRDMLARRDKARKSEILVPNLIPIGKILDIQNG